MKAQTLRREFQALSRVLQDTRARAEEGAAVDMAGLDARVVALCGAATALPRAKAVAVLPEMEAVIGDLDALAEALKRQRDLLAAAAEGRPDPHTARQRAAAAYGRPAAPMAPLPPAPDDPAES